MYVHVFIFARDQHNNKATNIACHRNNIVFFLVTFDDV